MGNINIMISESELRVKKREKKSCFYFNFLFMTNFSEI